MWNWYLIILHTGWLSVSMGNLFPDLHRFWNPRRGPRRTSGHDRKCLLVACGRPSERYVWFAPPKKWKCTSKTSGSLHIPQKSSQRLLQGISRVFFFLQKSQKCLSKASGRSSEVHGGLAQPPRGFCKAIPVCKREREREASGRSSEECEGWVLPLCTSEGSWRLLQGTSGFLKNQK